ncbi:DapH/DapD/GlmU-related protein [Paenibacillus polymyxa]|uniref:DapH/DapD/GlmU-related protein n=1 Tax=Paenibacillus polymyxa TaxID=1406 RepID=UPI002AB5D859|nr:DapH/DapD/GlmU-related protein [Paenibacillus polymyxa]MDY7989859.1 DapH/DapD/GlmU-related protein [Paenibacillus polymyxa]MDY8116782.1 DapH/DapD/GlmU-related protein [Paenibacillus polymyxa]
MREFTDVFKQIADLELLIRKGIKIPYPLNVVIESTVTLEEGCEIGAFSVIKGNSRIGKNVVVRESCYIENTVIDENSVVWQSTIINSYIENNTTVGPYAFIRGNSEIKENSQVGSYCEINDSILGKDTKSKHFSYLGHTVVGEKVNIGAGTVTCTFDGKNKHKLLIGDNAFIGSGSLLVGPVEVGENSFSGAGSVITRDIDKNSLVFGVPARKIRSL